MQVQRTCECGCGTEPKTGNRYVKGHNARRTWEQRARYVVTDSGCWQWQGRLSPAGYGLIWDNDRNRDDFAHRAVFEYHRGLIPVESDGLDHLCRNRACVNPDHLQPVSQATNSRRGSATKLTWNDVRAIRASPDTYRALARRFGVSSCAISNIKNYKCWLEGIEREWSTGASTDG